MKIVGDDGAELPWDGKAVGRADGARALGRSTKYFKSEGGDPLVKDAEGTAGFRPATSRRSTPSGFMQITDRSQGRDQVGRRMDRLDRPREHRHGASVRGRWRRASPPTHAKWDERPLLIVVKKPSAELTREELLALLRGPDRQVVDARRRRLRRRDPARRDRQDAEEPAARAVRPASARQVLSAARRRSAHADAGVGRPRSRSPCWGFFPVYFRLQPGIFAPEVLANRIVWALLLGGDACSTWQRALVVARPGAASRAA